MTHVSGISVEEVLEGAAVVGGEQVNQLVDDNKLTEVARKGEQFAVECEANGIGADVRGWTRARRRPIWRPKSTSQRQAPSRTVRAKVMGVGYPFSGKEEIAARRRLVARWAKRATAHPARIARITRAASSGAPRETTAS